MRKLLTLSVVLGAIVFAVVSPASAQGFNGGGFNVGLGPFAPAGYVGPGDISGVSLEQVEKRHILDVLAQTDWVIEGARGAAKILDLHPNTLRSRMKKLRIERAAMVSSHEISQPRTPNLA